MRLFPGGCLGPSSRSARNRGDARRKAVKKRPSPDVERDPPLPPTNPRKTTSRREPSPHCHCSCHAEVIASCESSLSDLQSQEELPQPPLRRKTSLSRGTRSLERPSSRKFDRPASLIMDMIYVTERIIVVTYPDSASPSAYKSNLAEVAGMLKVKHKEKYIIFNLSERRRDLGRLNPQVAEFGWPAYLAPPLERLCSMCKAIDSWLLEDPHHIVVLHSKGDKGRVGVVIAAYMHYSSICASADQALDRFAMKRVYQDKLAHALQPSQKRYIRYFSGLLSGAIKMNNNTLYLHHVVIHKVPGYDAKGGCRPFIKIYMGMQQVFTSGVYLATSRTARVTMALSPNLPLRGDILLVCYVKEPPGSSSKPERRRTAIFRIQFHTCTVEDGRKLIFSREEIDLPPASDFQRDGKVELHFSYTPEDFRGNGSVHDNMVPVETVPDSLVRWDSYEAFETTTEDNDDEDNDAIEYKPVKSEGYMEGPLDGSLYATVAKKKNQGPAQTTAEAMSDVDGPHLSMDSGISSSSGHPQGSPPLTSTPSSSVTDGVKSTGTPAPKRPPTKNEQAELDELLYGMLKEIQSIPDLPSTKKGSSATLPPGTRQSPSTNRDTKPPPHSTSTLPVTFRQAFSPPPPPTSTPTSSSSAKPLSNGPSRMTNGSWLQSQQEKLRARREGRIWEDRLLKEKMLLAELKDAQLTRKASLPTSLTNGTVPASITMTTTTATSTSSGSSNYILLDLAPPPGRKGENCTTPLHINTAVSGGSSTGPGGPSTNPVSTTSPTSTQSEPPPSPVIPSRTSSRDIRQRYQRWQQSQKVPLSRQCSDTTWDRHAGIRSPLSSASQARHFVYPTVHRTEGLLVTMDGGGRDCVDSPLFNSTPKYEEFGRYSTTPRETSPSSFTAKDLSFSDWSNGSSNPSVSPTAERPITPAFPVTPGTPYLNHEPLYLRKARSQSRQDHSPDATSSPINGQVSPTPLYLNQSQRSSFLSDNSDPGEQTPHFIKDTSKYWYKANISREYAIEVLKDKPPGSFIIRNSNSFPGAFGLALKVAVPPPNAKAEDSGGCELVRHYLIEPHTKGVQLKGCANEPVFGSLSALVYQHSLTPISLPCKLVIPDSDPVADHDCRTSSVNGGPMATVQAEAACNVLFLHTVDTESLTGPQAIRKALGVTLSLKTIVPTPVHFKVTPQGITLTDRQHKLFFRRHYPISNISHCGLDPDGRQWTSKDQSGSPLSGRCFGFVARKAGSRTDNQCHLFVELDQPASAIVSFVAKTCLIRNAVPL